MGYNWGSLAITAGALTVPFWGMGAAATAGVAALFGGADSALGILGMNKRAEEMEDDLKDRKEDLESEKIQLSESVEAEKKESFMDAINVMRANQEDTSKIRSNYAQRQSQADVFKTKQISEINKGITKTEDAIENIDSDWDVEDTLKTLGGAAIAGAESFAASKFKDILKTGDTVKDAGKVGETAGDVAKDVGDVTKETGNVVGSVAKDFGNVGDDIVDFTRNELNLFNYRDELTQMIDTSVLRGL